MRRKLLLLNAVLAGLFILGASELYRQIVEANGRYERLQAFADPKQPPEFPAPASSAPIRASDFMPVVDHLLFSEDRNATVVVETAEAPAAQRPPLPLLSGLVDFGDGPSALMTARADQPPSWIPVGGKIGDFVFEGVDGDNVKLSWKEQQFSVAKQELAQAPPAAGPRAATRTSSTRNSARNNARTTPAAGANAAAAAPNDLAGVGQDNRIGPEISPGRYRSLPGDDSPDGAEHNGYVKHVRQTPFGSSAWWEKKE